MGDDLKTIDFDNADLGLWAFMIAIAGLITALCLDAITEPTFVSLFSSCLVGIGSLANPAIGKLFKRKDAPVMPRPVGDIKP